MSCLSRTARPGGAPQAGKAHEQVRSVSPERHHRGRLGSRVRARFGPDAPLFPEVVREALIRRAVAAGLTPAHGDRFFTVRSARAGFVTQAAANGASERAIMDQGWWKSLQVACGYIRHGSVFTDNAASKLGL
jgi:N-methylhydantoinase A/oxoprolinase/acetone carboxylase beta subunit